jgi:hypothetical protein
MEYFHFCLIQRRSRIKHLRNLFDNHVRTKWSITGANHQTLFHFYACEKAPEQKHADKFIRSLIHCGWRRLCTLYSDARELICRRLIFAAFYESSASKTSLIFRPLRPVFAESAADIRKSAIKIKLF